MFSSNSDDHNPILNCPSRPLVKANIELAPSTCPRCASSNTKFCYYNNYSLSQPRYFCKGCRRYWTKGGSLRNVPVGGGCRKGRRRAKSSSSATNGNHDARQDPIATSTAGAEIDVAAVFAKFLTSHDQNSGNKEEVVNDQDSVFECKNPSDSVDTLQMDEGFSVNAQALIELHSILGEHETSQNVLLSDVTSAPVSCAWQPMLQLDDFGSFSVDDDIFMFI